MLLKEFTNGLKRELENNFISLEEKPQEGPTANLGNCPEETDRGEEEKNSFHFSESWRSDTQSHHKKGRGSREKSKKPRITEKVFLGSGQHPMGEAGRDKEALRPF